MRSKLYIQNYAHYIIHIKFCALNSANLVMRTKFRSLNYAHYIIHIKFCVLNSANLVMRTKFRSLNYAHQITNIKLCALSIIRILIFVRNYFKKMRTKYALNMVRSKLCALDARYISVIFKCTKFMRTYHNNFKRIILAICELI